MSALGGTLSPSQNRQFQYMTQGVYAQDDYRATSRLMLNLGFRYEFTTIPTDMNGGNWNIRNVATANGDGPNQGSVQGAFWGNNPSLHAFSPRVGFAWDPFGKGKTAIRGGAGIYYDVSNFGGLFSNLACCDPPLDYFLTVNNSNTTVAAMQAAGYPTICISAAYRLWLSPGYPEQSEWRGLYSTWRHFTSELVLCPKPADHVPVELNH